MVSIIMKPTTGGVEGGGGGGGLEFAFKTIVLKLNIEFAACTQQSCYESFNVPSIIPRTNFSHAMYDVGMLP